MSSAQRSGHRMLVGCIPQSLGAFSSGQRRSECIILLLYSSFSRFPHSNTSHYFLDGKDSVCFSQFHLLSSLRPSCSSFESAHPRSWVQHIGNMRWIVQMKPFFTTDKTHQLSICECEQTFPLSGRRRKRDDISFFFY